MTAIYGLFNFATSTPERDIARLEAALAPYGADDVSSWVEGAIGVGRRLKRLLDEDRYDRQPVAGSRYVVVADVRLTEREALGQALGIPDPSKLADADLVAAAIEVWHEGAFDRIYGAFAVAAFDRQAQRLLLARDHFGMKPLFYHASADFFAFASMPAGIHALPEAPRGPDTVEVRRFLRLATPSPTATFFKGICRVNPGHYAIVTADGVSQERYWKPDLTPLRLSAPADYETLLAERLNQAVASSLRGAVSPVAIQMSGGFDSTTVGALAAIHLQESNVKLISFTSVPREGFNGAVAANAIADEGPLARAVADLYPNIEPVMVRSAETPMTDIDRKSGHYAQPMLNLCNLVWVNAIDSEARRRGARIMLHGSMGNATISETGVTALTELFFAGRFTAWFQIARALVDKGRMRWRGVVWLTLGSRLPPRIWRWGQRITDRGSLPFARYSGAKAGVWAAATQQAQFTNAQAHPLDRVWLRDRDAPERDVLTERLAGMTNDLGAAEKAILAAWGLDYRDPTADRRLVEFTLRVPAEELIRDGQPRSLLLRTFGHLLPDVILNNRKKGYQAADWYDSLTRAKDAVAAELDRIEMFEPTQDLIDVDRLRRLVADWPELDSPRWSDPEVVADYRHALLRGISAAGFMRKAAGSNY
jgi:asparagine synthase (glutamine-hydrolysing)